ncbi:hypothetical protein FJT64_008871 [Amphibalanus amphitrite]|uniref:Uncharacterized protein n=1 Tax=Amphibalanus amphitrite TaxID=1232801 RepID=A0A6A4VGZ8_AMPAM|nr:hypothetical protein FJT64_008871 [Amphibalanus amphitrite]
MGLRRGAAAASKALTPLPPSSPATSSTDSDPALADDPADDPADETLAGWTGWFLRNYTIIQFVLTVNTALLWWLGTTEAVSTSLKYVFNSMRETFGGLGDLDLESSPLGLEDESNGEELG